MLKQVREQQGRLTNRSMDSIMQQMREVINAKKMVTASNNMFTQPISQQQTITTTTMASSVCIHVYIYACVRNLTGNRLTSQNRHLEESIQLYQNKAKILTVKLQTIAIAFL